MPEMVSFVCPVLVFTLLCIYINGAACSTTKGNSPGEFFCIAGEPCTVGILEAGRTYYIAKECNGITDDSPYEITPSRHGSNNLVTFRWKAGRALPKGTEAWLYSFCKVPLLLVSNEDSTLISQFMVINRPKHLFHYLDRNNEFTISVEAPAGPKLSMRVSFDLSNSWNDKSLSFDLENVNKKRFGSIFLGDWIASNLQQQLYVDFFTFYLDIMSPYAEGYIANYKSFTAFNMSAIIRSHNILTEEAIILQVVGVAPKTKAKYSVQSVDATNTNASICGHDNTLWYKMDIPFFTKSTSDEKYTVFALPRDLYGQTVLICANISERTGSFEHYNIPIHVANLGSSKIPGKLLEFQSDSLGIANITFSKQQLHPMSEIMLVEYKAEDARKRVFTYLNPLVYPLRTPYPSQQPTTKPREFTQWYLSHHMALTPNYVNTELWSSNPREAVYYKKGTGLIFPPRLSFALGDHKLKWSVGKMQFKQLYFGSTTHYAIMLCDRWKHPYCLHQSDFDEPIGYVLKCPFERDTFEATFRDGVLYLDFATRDYIEPPLIKIVLLDNVRYANMDTVCQRTGTLVPLLERPSSATGKGSAKRYHLKYATVEFDMGSSYCVCFLEIGINTPEGTGWKRFFKNTEGAAKRSYDWKRWKFFKLIYTPSITPRQRLTLTKGLDGNDDLFFPTTNPGPVVIDGIYLTPNLKTDCSAGAFYDKNINNPIKAGQAVVGKKSTTQKPNFFDEITLRLSAWWNPYANLFHGARTARQPAVGTWLLHNTGEWTRTNTNLVLNLPGKKEKRVEKILKICICSYGKCTDGGNYVDSPVERYYFNRYHGDRGIYTDLLAEGLYCMYNKMVLECYNGDESIGKALRNPVYIPFPQHYKIKQLAYYQPEDMLIMLMDYGLYIYSVHKKKNFKLNDFKGIERIFTLQAATYALTTQGVLSALKNEYNLANKLKGMNSTDPYYWTPMSATWSRKVLEENALQLERCTMPIRQVSVIESTEENQVEMFFIDANNFVHYYTHNPGTNTTTIGGTGSSTTNQVHPKHITSFPIKKYLPQATGDFILRAKAIQVNNERHVVLFLYNKGDIIIKVFILRAHSMIFYSDIEASPNMMDFSIPNTNLLALNVNVMPKYKVSQYLTLVRLDNAMTLRFYYPTWIHHMKRDVKYIFTPMHISGHILNFAVKDPAAFAKTGLSLNASTGVITGTLAFVGKMDIEVIAQGYLGQTSALLQLISTCGIGYQPGPNNVCVKCPIGTFGDSSESGECKKCSDFIKDSTTREVGAMIPSSCVCEPGYFLNVNKCEKCPGGTYSDIYGASRCFDGCKLNETSYVTGARSQNEVKCTCKPGFYSKKNVPAKLLVQQATARDSAPGNAGTGGDGGSGSGASNGVDKAAKDDEDVDECIPCEIGSYCLGGSKPPVPCPSRMSTASVAASSLSECVCEPGYELKSGVCRPCHQTSYKEGLGNYACSSCTNMESIGGSIFSSKFASTSRDDCRFCKPGYFFDVNRLSCINCPALNFCPGADLPPLVCPSNTLTHGKLVTASSDCLCTRGHGLHSVGRGLLFLGNPCAPCPNNTFQHLDGYSLPCMPCPNNMYTATPGSSSLADCLPLPGYFSLVGEAQMPLIVANMEVDHHKDRRADDLIISCTQGIVLHQSFSISVLQPNFESCLDLCKRNSYCKWAYYMQRSSSIPHREPILLSLDSNAFIDYWPCKLTMITDRVVDMHTNDKLKLQRLNFDMLNEYKTASNILCKIERDDYVVDVVAKQMLISKCPRNYYCPGGTLSKSKCPENSITLSTGATRITDCLCLPGFEPTETATSVVCKACKRGTFKNTISNEACAVCPIGMTTSDVGAVNASQCTCISNLYAQLRHWPGDEQRIDVGTAVAKIFTRLAGTSAPLQTTALTLPITTSVPIECKSCPRGHYCSGEWLNIGDMYIHTPPASCPAGAAVPKVSHRASSISKCLCVPGYGIGTRITENFTSCTSCPPGTFKGTYENTPCLGRCAPYAITLPGAESIHDCFCMPGRFMTVRRDKSVVNDDEDEEDVDDEYEYECVKCIEGAVCPGGFRNVSKRAVHAYEDYDETGAKKGISLYEHSIPYPRMGYTAIFKRNSTKGGMHESKRNRSLDLIWKPNLPNDGYRTSPPKEHELEEFDHIPDLHPCVYASRCRGTTDYACQKGSEGYSCSNCQADADVKYFQSGCSKCKSTAVEFLWLVYPRVCFLAVVVGTSWLAKVGTINGEFSLLPLLKIWYHFTISVLVLGMSPITSISSMRNFYHSYKSILYKPIMLFANVERLGCWTRYVNRIIRLLNDIGMSRSLFDGSVPLTYVQIWYLERFVAIFKPVLDVLLLLLLHLCFHLAYKLASKNKQRYKRLEARMLLVASKLQKQQDEANARLGDGGAAADAVVERAITLEKLLGSKTLDDVYASFCEANKPCKPILTQIILLLVLHLPSIWLNSISLFWCRGIRYKQEPVLMVLLHLPHQECHSNDPLYWLGVRLGIAVLGASLLSILLLLLLLAGGTKSIAYNPRSWRGIFQSGYHSNFIWWDVLLLARQFASIWLLVAQYGHDPKGASEHVRVSGFIVVCIVYASLHLAFSPYDCRSYNSLNILETQTLFVSFVLGLLMQGSFYYDLSHLAALPLFLCFYIHVSIVWHIIVQIGLYKSITSPLNGDGDSSDFVTLLLGHLPQVSNAKDAGVYYDYKDDTLVLEQRVVYSFGWRFFQRLSKRGRLLMDAAKAFVKTSRAFNQNSRQYLVQCIELAIDRGNILDKDIVLSNAWMYFVVRFSYWYTHCMHINLAPKDENTHVSDKDFILKLSFMHLFPQHNEVLDTLVCDFLLKVPLGTLKSHNVIHHHHSQGQQLGICNGQCEPLKTDNLSLRVTHIAECLIVDSLYMDFYDLGPMSLTEMYMALLALGHFTKETLSRIFTIFKFYSMYKRDRNHYQVVRQTLELGQAIEDLQQELKSKGKRGLHLHKQHMMTNQLQDVEQEIEELNMAIDEQKQVIMAARAAAAVALNLHLGVDAIVADDISNEDILKAIGGI